MYNGLFITEIPKRRLENHFRKKKAICRSRDLLSKTPSSAVDVGATKEKEKEK